jgi:branched-chain amino acid transport system substrate-binding protein
MRRRALLSLPGACLALPVLAAPTTGVSANEILIGHTGILSGPLGAQVKVMLSGAQLVFDDSNRRGGVSGRSVRVLSIDDELKPDLAVANYRKLLNEEQVFAFFGCVGSGTTAAAASLLKDSGAPSIGGYAVADSAREMVRGAAYFVRSTTGRESETLVRHLTTIGMTKIGVAYLDNPGGVEVLGLIRSAMAEHKIEPFVATAMKGDGSNVADVAAKMADPQVQAVIMYLGGPLPAGLMKAVASRGSHPKFYGLSIVSGALTAKLLGDAVRGLAISQVVPYPWAPIDPLTIEFRQAAEKAQIPVDYYSFEGYLNARVLLDGLRRCGRDLSRPALHAAMRSSRLSLAGMNLDFSSGAPTGSRFVELVQVSVGGRFLR